MSDRLQRVDSLSSLSLLHRVFLLAILTTLLTGCGQRGGLYLPSQNKPGTATNVPANGPINPPADNTK